MLLTCKAKRPKGQLKQGQGFAVEGCVGKDNINLTWVWFEMSPGNNSSGNSVEFELYYQQTDIDLR